MALGRTSITSVRENAQTLKSICQKDIRDCWNTYQYCTDYLENWADETTIGNEVRDNLKQLSKGLLELINRTEELGNKIQAFTDKQENINS